MTQEDLFKRFHASLEQEGVLTTTKSKSEELVRCFCRLVADYLELGHEVALPALGKFKTKRLAAMQNKNPKTGVVQQIPARRTVRFAPGAELKRGLALHKDR